MRLSIFIPLFGIICIFSFSSLGYSSSQKGQKKHRVAALDKEAKALIEKMDARLAEIKGFSAKFRQRFHNAQTGRVEESFGTVVMKKPLKMRWEYLTPEQQTIVADGTTLYYYLPTDKQVIVEPLSAVVHDRSPALFLAGERKMQELFYVSRVRQGEAHCKIPGGVYLALEPKVQSLAVTRIVVAADGQDYTVKALSLYDWAGNRNDIEFSGLKLNEDVDNGVFRFVRPEGVEVVEPPHF